MTGPQNPTSAAIDGTLDGLYYAATRTYFSHNFDKDRHQVLNHLTEMIGGMSLLASEKPKPGIIPQRFIPKTILWWFALCSKVGIRSVEELLWVKFPYVCPYCIRAPHTSAACKEARKLQWAPDWTRLREEGERNRTRQPRTLPDWQRMFNEIYPVTEFETYSDVIVRFAEETGELAEAVRAFDADRGLFVSEAADVFAWTMHLANLWDVKHNVPVGKETLDTFRLVFPGQCPECHGTTCHCPALLPSTIGRIGDAAPETPALDRPLFATRTELTALFMFGADSARTLDTETLGRIQSGVAECVRSLRMLHAKKDGSDEMLRSQLSSLEQLAADQQAVGQAVALMSEQINALPSEERSLLLDLLTGSVSGLFVAAIAAASGAH